jgi:hypothetical protein
VTSARDGTSKRVIDLREWLVAGAWRGRDALPRDRRCTSGKLLLLIAPRNSLS